MEKPISAMDIFEWTPEYAVRIAEIDGEHRLWLETMNRFHQAMLNGTGKEFFRAEFTGAAHLLLVHLDHEEELMTAARYPHIRAQRRENDGFRNTCRMFMERFEQGEDALTVELMLAVTVGTVRHAASAIRLARYLKSRENTAA